MEWLVLAGVAAAATMGPLRPTRVAEADGGPLIESETPRYQFANRRRRMGYWDGDGNATGNAWEEWTTRRRTLPKKVKANPNTRGEDRLRYVPDVDPVKIHPEYYGKWEAFKREAMSMYTGNMEYKNSEVSARGLPREYLRPEGLAPLYKTSSGFQTQPAKTVPTRIHA
jgi:hypothetical protein